MADGDGERPPVARGRLQPPPRSGRVTARDAPPVVPWLSRQVGCCGAESHHPGDTCLRAQAGDGVDPRGSVAAVPTAKADRECCQTHAGMGAWMGQYLGGVHACPDDRGCRTS